MQHVNPASGNKPLHSVQLKTLGLALACAGALLAVGCDSQSQGNAASGETPTQATAATKTTKVSKSLGDKPCDLVTKETVAATFDIPADEIEQSKLSSMCEYRWEDDQREVFVTAYIDQIHDDARSAASQFDGATRSLTGAQVDSAFEHIAEQAKKSKDALDTPGKQRTADAILGGGKSSGARGIQFEDVDGIPDQARFNLSTGALHMRHGNLVFNLNAYAGEKMPMPSPFSAAALVEASKVWLVQTLPQRRQDAMLLAKAALKQL